MVAASAQAMARISVVAVAAEVAAVAVVVAVVGAEVVVEVVEPTYYSTNPVSPLS